MKNIEPQVFRQRIILEGHYAIEPDNNTLKNYMRQLSLLLKMRIFTGPFSWPLDKWDNPDVKMYGFNDLLRGKDPVVTFTCGNFVSFLVPTFTLVNNLIQMKL